MEREELWRRRERKGKRLGDTWNEEEGRKEE